MCVSDYFFTVFQLYSKVVVCISFFFFKFYFTILYCFCHTSTSISHGCTRVPHHNPIPQGHPSAPALSTPSHESNLDWRSVSHMIIHTIRVDHFLTSPAFFPFLFYLFLAVLALHCYTGFSPVAASGGYSLVAEWRLLPAVASLCSGAQAL